MKQILFASLMLFCLIITSCSSETDKLASEYESIIGSKPEQKEGVYTWKNLSKEQFYKNGKILKEKTDKILGFLPSETNDKTLNEATGDLFTSYVWENSDIRICLWLDYSEGKEFIQLITKEKQ